MGIPGLATKEGTSRFIERFPGPLGNATYRRFRKLRASSVGVGTYFGEPGDKDDEAYRRSITRALALGCNVIDTAIVYRHMSSERVIGQVLQAEIGAGRLQRDEVLVCTKGGYLPFDTRIAAAPGAYWREKYFDTGILQPAEVEKVSHSLRPAFIRAQLDQSLENLGLDAVDVYYLHNPETQLEIVDRKSFLLQLQAAFAVLEEAVSEGKIGCYGLATWHGFRVPEEKTGYLSIAEVLQCARDAGGDEHHFAAIQLPLNLSKTEAVSLNKQTMKGKPAKISVAAAAAESRIGLFASSTLDSGRLTRYLPPVVKQHFKKLSSDVQVAVQFSRSCPAVVSALVGMKTDAHVDEILGVFQVNPEAPENFVRLFESPDRSLVRR